jgi:hypothetical protein
LKTFYDLMGRIRAGFPKSTLERSRSFAPVLRKEFDRLGDVTVQNVTDSFESSIRYEADVASVQRRRGVVAPR